jgi:hypothetical protein
VAKSKKTGSSAKGKKRQEEEETEDEGEVGFDEWLKSLQNEDEGDSDNEEELAEAGFDRETTPVLGEGCVLHPETHSYLQSLPVEERRRTLWKMQGSSTSHFDQMNGLLRIKWRQLEFARKKGEEEAAGKEGSRSTPSETTVASSSIPATAMPSAETTATLVTTATPKVTPPTVTSSPAPAPASLKATPTAMSSAGSRAASSLPESSEVIAKGGVNDNLDGEQEDVPMRDEFEQCTLVEEGPESPSSSDSNETEVGVDRSGWPGWLHSSWNTFLEPAEMKTLPNWVDVLKDWAELERKYGFENPIGSKAFFPNIGRPNCVHWWSQHGKMFKLDGPRDMPEPTVFAEGWWRWWSAINPEWRNRDDRGRVINDGYGGEREEKGDKSKWECLKRPGQCGFFTVLMCLFYWRRKATTEAECLVWSEALKDVGWVLQEMNKNTRLVAFVQ